MITIGYVIDTLETATAGTEKQLLMLLRGLDRSRFTPVLITLRSSRWLRENDPGCEVIDLGLANLRSPGLWRALNTVKRLHRERHFGLLQTFFKDGNVFGTVAARFAGCPILVSSRRNIGYWHTRFDIEVLRLLRHWTTHYLANSRAVVEVTIEQEKADRSRTTIIYNGLDLDHFAVEQGEERRSHREQWSVADDEILVGMVANLRPVKNVASLVAAAEAICQDHPDVRFVVLGEGSERGALQQRIDSAGLSGRFRLPGAVEDVAGCLAAFDVAVLTSRSESFSNSLVEYMAAGLPVVASAVGGNVEAITEGETGLLYASGDTAMLTSQLLRLIDDRELAASLGRAARTQAFARYSRESCIHAHEEFYESIIRRTPS